MTKCDAEANSNLNKLDWSSIEWGMRVSICETGRASENSLLQNYRIIFVAMEAILLAGAFGVGWDEKRGIIFLLGAIYVGILWIIVCNSRANLVDDWEAMLAELWNEVGLDEIQMHYRDAQIRKKAREEKLSIKTVLRRYTDIFSARWVLNLIIPSIAIFISLLLIILYIAS